MSTDGVGSSVQPFGAEEAWLWAPPDQQPPAPPVTTKPERLPIHKLSWENTERLFLRLLEKQGKVQWAKLYGTSGQHQEGIDAYARLIPLADNAAGDSRGRLQQRPYAVLQSRRVERLYPSGIKSAVADFLAGDWSDDTGTFFYATSFDLTDTRLDAALRESADRLAEVEIRFVPWGVVEVSELLRSLPRLVDDFFGRAWVEHFCGPSALAALSPRLTFSELRDLRGRLAELYAAVFDSQAAIRRPTDGASVGRAVGARFADGHFIMPDVSSHSSSIIGDLSLVADDIARAEGNESLTPRWSIPGRSSTDSVAKQELPRTTLSESSSAITEGGERVVNSSRLGRQRRCLRSVRALLVGEPAPEGDNTFREPADTWLSLGNRNLLVGDPGSGKSSLLRFVALDLLSEVPQSVSLQREHGGRLPIWLPFGFLCRHLDEAQSNSLVSAIQTWLRSRAANDLCPLVERALEDDRLLLLIDGLDEWTSRDAANVALDSVETFLGRTDAAAFLSSRPYAVGRLVSALTWRRADMCALSDGQRREIASQYLVPTPDTSSPSDDAQRTAASWEKPFVEPFIDQLSSVPELSTLSRTPLFLALLATTWQGEPLPSKRYELFASIIDLLIRRHPQMRRRASRVGELPLTDREFRLAVEAVAYRLRAEGNIGPVPTFHVRQLLQEAFSDDEIGGYPPSDARRMADAAMQLAEGEFGLLVDQGADHVGFIHRVVLDQLAGQRLAKLSTNEQIEVFNARHTDPSWLDVLLASLAAQPNPPTVAGLIDAVLDASGEHLRGWPWDVRREQSAHELLGAALASGVEVSPRKIYEYLDLLVDQVDSPLPLEHRAALVTSLVRVHEHTTHGRRLTPVFKRWLDATRPYPAAALYAMRNLAIDDERAKISLLRGMRSDHEASRINAAAAYAHRFGEAYNAQLLGPEGRTAEVDPVVSQTMLRNLEDAIRQGPTSDFQAAALLAIGYGWLNSQVAQEHIAWARKQPVAIVRTIGLYLASKSKPDIPIRDFVEVSETEWILSQIRYEAHVLGDFGTGFMNDLLERAVSESDREQREGIADFVLETLSGNGRNGGDRAMCWRIACTALAEEAQLRDWVISELRSDQDRPLILYNLRLMPAAWREHPDMQSALGSRSDEHTEWSPELDLELSPALPTEQVRTRLLKALNSYRPWGIAHRLLEDFADDDGVREELLARLQDDKTGGRFAPIALDVMGIESGFARLFSLLVAANESGGEIDNQDHVLLAQSVAQAWRRIRELSAQDLSESSAEEPSHGDRGRTNTAGGDVEQATRVLSAYNEDDVCAACTSVTTRVFGWHIPDIISTWPDRTVDYALEALADDRHITEGVDDLIHSAVLRAHQGRPTDRADEVMGAALDLLTFLEAELREVLVHELCSIGIESDRLLNLLSAFQRDGDDGVRRTAVVGITQTLMRENKLLSASDVGTETPELDAWRQSIRDELCAYGPTMDEDRQNAWVAMLMMREFTLIDGLHETLGQQGVPGVRLTDIFGSPDDLLIELVVSNWDALDRHFGEQLLSRLSAERGRATESVSVISAVRSLALAGDKHPAVNHLVKRFRDARRGDRDGLSHVARLVSTENLDDKNLRRALDDLELSPELIDWNERQGSSGSEIVRLLLQANDAGGGGPRRGRASDRWAVTRLMDKTWHRLGLEELREVLKSDLLPDGWHGDQTWLHVAPSGERCGRCCPHTATKYRRGWLV